MDVTELIRKMLEYIDDLFDGTEISTSQLVEAVGAEVEADYLFLIHEALIEAAKEKGITLDMSKHEGMDEGLPYNLPFIIRFENSKDDWFDDDSPEMCPGNPGVGE